MARVRIVGRLEKFGFGKSSAKAKAARLAGLDKKIAETDAALPAAKKAAAVAAVEAGFAGV